MRARRLLFWVVLGVLGCRPAKPAPKASWSELQSDAGTVACERCVAFPGPARVGELENAELTELSGLVAGSVDGVYFAHNDSGDSARFFALGPSGKHLGEFRLKGVQARDIEAIAFGPCPEGQCLFLGDFGDNRRVRDDYALYRVPEPQLSKDAAVRDVAFVKMSFVYPSGAQHNAEALVVEPEKGIPYVLTKRAEGEASEVFRFPLGGFSETPVTLEKVATLPATDASVTAADYHPCGRRLLLRTYRRVLLFVAPEGGDFESVFSATPLEVPSVFEPQGEAIAFSRDGRAFLTVSEGRFPYVHASFCGAPSSL